MRRTWELAPGIFSWKILCSIGVHSTFSLNEFAIAHGGRVYLAKDALTTATHFRAMYPRLAEFEAVRGKWDPHGRISSAQARRLFGR